MRELYVVDSESTTSSLVLRDENGEEFFLPVDEELRSLLTESTDTDSAAATVSTEPELSPVHAIGRPDEDDEPQPEEPEPEEPAAETPQADDVPSQPSPLQSVPAPTPEAPRPLSDAMSMRPAEIQNRIRAGATSAELADEMGVAESRVDAFAHPVMLERERIAQLAKQAHPVREDGPADLTLWEILATAFAARGHSLNEAEWTAYRQQGEPWDVRVTWTAGLSENEAEWTLKQNRTSNATVEARNSVAADLVDPDFVQPVRSLTSVGRGARYDEAIDGDHPGEATAQPMSEFYDQEDDDLADTRDDVPRVEETDAEGDEDFLQHPDPAKKPSKRRRKAVTPHWEDVLLGVRTNTKRPRK